jgi:ABC-type dipeptide/oligopeptide/nickel transport system ATPase component
MRYQRQVTTPLVRSVSRLKRAVSVFTYRCIETYLGSCIFQEQMIALDPVFTIGVQIAETVMIFTPCRDGTSHNTNEEVDRALTLPGANLLLNAALKRANRQHSRLSEHHYCARAKGTHECPSS